MALRVRIILIMAMLMAVVFCQSGSRECYFTQQGYNISWTYDKNSDRVTFQLEHRFRQPILSDVWSGVAIGRTMNELDVMVAIVDHRTGTVQMSDRSSSFYTAPKPDRSDDVRVSNTHLIDGGMQVTFSRPLNTGDWQDQTLAGCPWMVFPVSGGEVESGGELIKHWRTPIVKQYCDIVNSCASTNAHKLIKPSSQNQGVTREPWAFTTNQLNSLLDVQVPAKVFGPHLTTRHPLAPPDNQDVWQTSTTRQPSRPGFQPPNNDPVNDNQSSGRRRKDQKCARPNTGDWCVDYVNGVVDWWQKNKQHEFAVSDMCTLLVPVEQVCCDEVLRRNCELRII